MKRWHRAAIALGLSAIVASCKPSIQGGGGSDTSAEEACAKLAAATCEREFALDCITEDPSAKACEERETEYCVESLDLPGVVFDADAALRCAAALPTLDCGQIWSTTAACPVRTGTREPGEPCVEGAQCTSGSCSGDMSSCGKCMSLASEGEPCQNSFVSTDGGTICEGSLVCSGSPLRCMKPGTFGAACSGSEPCGAFFACEHGACAKLGAGAPCAANADACDGQKDLICDPASQRCEKVTVPKPVGCEAHPCPADQYCYGQPTPVCRKEAPEGSACSFDLPCIWPSWCDDGICTSTPIACD